MTDPFILTRANSIANHFLSELRDITIQKDRLRFRKNLERIGELLAYELSKTLPYKKDSVSSPLGICETTKISSDIVIAVILRAGLPMYQGVLNYFDHAESAFVGAYRGAHRHDHSFDINMDYIASPGLDGKILILVDPMLATGKSLCKTAEELFNNGKPAEVHILAAIAAPEGIGHVKLHLPMAKLWLGAVDSNLNSKFYIVPGLGDAGDLAFGPKE